MSRSTRGESTVVRWRDGAGQQRAATFDRPDEAEAFDESVKRVSAVLGRDSLPSRESAARDAVYPYRLNDGTTRYYVKYRTSDGRSATKRGFGSRRAARAWKHDIAVKARRGEVRQSQRPLAEDFDAWLSARKPYLTVGTWRDYEIHGRVRIKPFLGELGVRRLRQLDGGLVSDWLSVLLESERWGGPDAARRAGESGRVAPCFPRIPGIG